MRVFVLTTGRSGSTTFARACQHFTNFTAGHESNWNSGVPDRLVYPDHHIEADNRLCWFLGTLARMYPDAYYVHLTRTVEKVADSYADRWGPDPARLSGSTMGNRLRRGLLEKHPRVSMANAFAYAIYGRTTPWPREQRRHVSRLMIDSINANVVEFLEDRPSMTIDLESAAEQLPLFAEWIGAEGNLAGAIAEFSTRHNARALR